MNKKTKYWTVINPGEWKKRDYPCWELEDLLDKLNYYSLPDIVIGSDDDFVAIFPNKETDQFLFHFKIDNFEELVFAENLPSMMNLMEQSHFLILGHFKTKQIVREL